MTENVMINGKEYVLSPLRAKHLRKMSEILEQKAKQPTKGLFSELEAWFPFIADSIKIEKPDFNSVELDELTIEEFNTIWAKLVSISGVNVVNKGETQPTSSPLIGAASIPVSPA